MNKYDVAILGGGPGGYSAALKAASYGLSVALIEKSDVGGVCLNRGCVPAKVWISAAETADHARFLNSLAKEPFEYEIDPAKMLAAQKKITSQFVKSLSALMEKRGVTIISGAGKFKSVNTMEITGADGATSEIGFENAIIATGTEPAKIFDLPKEAALTNSTVFDIESIPESILIVGAGAIGCELAGVMARLGAKVTLAELMPRILPMEDAEISALMAREFKKQKIKILTGVKIVSAEYRDGAVIATLESGETITAEKILTSIGRIFATGALGLAEAGVKTGERGEIVTDDFMKTSADNIYAVGDVAGKNMLAYTAYKEGAIAAGAIAGKEVKIEKSVIPSAIFTIPEIGSVGLTQEQAPENAKVGTFLFRALARAHATGEIAGMVKVIADTESDKLLGVHIIGPRATDMIHIASVALSQGMTAEALGSLLFAHPTFAEAIVEAVHDARGEAFHK